MAPPFTDDDDCAGVAEAVALDAKAADVLVTMEDVLLVADVVVCIVVGDEIDVLVVVVDELSLVLVGVALVLVGVVAIAVVVCASDVVVT